MSPKMMHRAPVYNNLVATPSATPERDAANFDFRTLTLLLILVTRQDLLQEYLDGGKDKDARNVPLAVQDPNRWPNLRTLFDPEMLGQMLYLFELGKTQVATHHLRLVFQTMINLGQYDQETCPGDFIVQSMVTYSQQLTHPLNQAGIAD
jgi:hypothetical protein